MRPIRAWRPSPRANVRHVRFKLEAAGLSVRHRKDGRGHDPSTDPKAVQRPGPGKHTAVQQVQSSKLYASWNDSAGAGARPQDGAEAKPGESDPAHATLEQGEASHCHRPCSIG